MTTTGLSPFFLVPALDSAHKLFKNRRSTSTFSQKYTSPTNHGRPDIRSTSDRKVAAKTAAVPANNNLGKDTKSSAKTEFGLNLLRRKKDTIELKPRVKPITLPQRAAAATMAKPLLRPRLSSATFHPGRPAPAGPIQRTPPQSAARSHFFTPTAAPRTSLELKLVVAESLAKAREPALGGKENKPLPASKKLQLRRAKAVPSLRLKAAMRARTSDGGSGSKASVKEKTSVRAPALGKREHKAVSVPMQSQLRCVPAVRMDAATREWTSDDEFGTESIIEEVSPPANRPVPPVIQVEVSLDPVVTVHEPEQDLAASIAENTPARNPAVESMGGMLDCVRMSTEATAEARERLGKIQADVSGFATELARVKEHQEATAAALCQNVTGHHNTPSLAVPPPPPPSVSCELDGFLRNQGQVETPAVAGRLDKMLEAQAPERLREAEGAEGSQGDRAVEKGKGKTRITRQCHIEDAGTYQGPGKPLNTVEKRVEVEDPRLPITSGLRQVEDAEPQTQSETPDMMIRLRQVVQKRDLSGKVNSARVTLALAAAPGERRDAAARGEDAIDDQLKTAFARRRRMMMNPMAVITSEPTKASTRKIAVPHREAPSTSSIPFSSPSSTATAILTSVIGMAGEIPALPAVVPSKPTLSSEATGTYVTEVMATPFGVRRVRKLLIPPLTDSPPSQDVRVQMELKALREQRMVGSLGDGLPASSIVRSDGIPPVTTIMGRAKASRC